MDLAVNATLRDVDVEASDARTRARAQLEQALQAAKAEASVQAEQLKQAQLARENEELQKQIATDRNHDWSLEFRFCFWGQAF